ncbi:MAG: phytanoyl-CoA dioxygenase family protein [Bacteroidetes bacterium]|nr:phytanoyl-CoA dioxygenase family protein [Bacteroidota bacterium]
MLPGWFTVKEELFSNGFATVHQIFTVDELENIETCIANSSTVSRQTFRKSADLFAIRQLLKEIPALQQKVFNDKMRQLITTVMGKEYFVSKSIYFDKPAASNWFVSYHQDLTISVDKKIETEHYGPWTKKQNQFSVQPPQHILEDNFTIRIHLDDTGFNNGALRVIPGSHQNGICRAENINRTSEKICDVPAGGVMIMKPLLFHSSAKTVNNKPRRVIHIEFSRKALAGELRWAEYINLDRIK